MEPIQKFLQKYGLLIILVLLTIIFFRGCGSNGDMEYNHQEELNKLDSIVNVVDGLKVDVVKTIKIEGLKTEKRVLINTNDIFLTHTRPDGRFLEIDKVRLF